MKKINIIYIITFIVAFCSIAYELLLSQSLSAFLGNTVLRYSVTIGLYLLSLGIGSFFAKGRFAREPVISLQIIEIALTVLGGFSVALLFLVDSLDFSTAVFSIFAHALIVAIGILSGFEIPLLIEIGNQEKENSENAVLGIDYIGTFFGTVAFAFIFYPKMGLLTAAFAVGLLNSSAGLSLFTQKNKCKKHGRHKALLMLQAVVLAVIIIFAQNAENMNEYLINNYLL